MNKWNKIEDRKPVTGEICILFKNNWMGIGVYIESSIDYMFLALDRQHQYGGITHWQRAPSIPMEYFKQE